VNADVASAADALAVLVGPGVDEPERLLRIGRPRAGRVQVLEWSAADWSRPAESRECDARALLEELEHAARRRRRLSEEPRRLREWLLGG
jgi:hypothetical protein